MPWLTYVLSGLAVLVGLYLIYIVGRAALKWFLFDYLHIEGVVAIDVDEEEMAWWDEHQKKIARSYGVLSIDASMAQLCGACNEIWMGEVIRSGKCPKCSNPLTSFNAPGAPLHRVVISERRLHHLLRKIWGWPTWPATKHA